jgi:hypothetical protein
MFGIYLTSAFCNNPFAKSFEIIRMRYRKKAISRSDAVVSLHEDNSTGFWYNGINMALHEKFPSLSHYTKTFEITIPDCHII